MAIPYLFVTDVKAGSPDDVTTAASGGTALDGASAVLEVAYDDTAFTDAEGKERLILALERIVQRLKESDYTWPTS